MVIWRQFHETEKYLTCLLKDPLDHHRDEGLSPLGLWRRWDWDEGCLRGGGGYLIKTEDKSTVKNLRSGHPSKFTPKSDLAILREIAHGRFARRKDLILLKRTWQHVFFNFFFSSFK